MASLSLAEPLARVPDPRQDSGKRHSLAALLNVVASAVVGGMRRWEAIAHCGRSLSPATAKELGCTHAKTPCQSTLSVVLRAVDAVNSRVTWAQTPVGDMTNEPKAALDLLRQVPVAGRVVRGGGRTAQPAWRMSTGSPVGRGKRPTLGNSSTCCGAPGESKTGSPRCGM